VKKQFRIEDVSRLSQAYTLGVESVGCGNGFNLINCFIMSLDKTIHFCLMYEIHCASKPKTGVALSGSEAQQKNVLRKKGFCVKLKYPIAIEPGDEKTAFGVVVPDLPGCFSAGDSMAEAIENSKEAISSWIEITLGEGRTVPAPGKLSDHLKNPEYAGWLWATVEINDDRMRTIGKKDRPFGLRPPTIEEMEWVESWAKRYVSRVPKGVFRYKSHEEANADWDKWMAQGSFKEDE
jgi:predicted RNase H-like HicB family nuclease